jgi:hypothetical protein
MEKSRENAIILRFYDKWVIGSSEFATIFLME